LIALDLVGSPMDIEVETDVDKFPVAHPASSNAIKTSDSAGCAFATSCDAMPGIVSVTSTDVKCSGCRYQPSVCARSFPFRSRARAPLASDGVMAPFVFDALHLDGRRGAAETVIR